MYKDGQEEGKINEMNEKELFILASFSPSL